MGRFYDDKIEFAIQNIWGHSSSGKEKEALKLLTGSSRQGRCRCLLFSGKMLLGEVFCSRKVKIQREFQVSQ